MTNRTYQRAASKEDNWKEKENPFQMSSAQNLQRLKAIMWKRNSLEGECLNLLLPVTPDLVSERQAGADVLRNDHVTAPRRPVQQLAGNGEAVIAEEMAKRVQFIPSLCVCVCVCTCVNMCSSYLEIQVGCSW